MSANRSGFAPVKARMGDENGQAAENQKKEGESENPMRYSDGQWMTEGMTQGINVLNSHVQSVPIERGLSHSLGAYYQQYAPANCTFRHSQPKLGGQNPRFAPWIWLGHLKFGPDV